MKGILGSDVCFSTIKGKVGNAFNTDGKERDRIDLDEARKIFSFDIEKHRSFTQDGRQLLKNWHLRRSDNDEIIPTKGLGDEFQPIQHLSVFDYLCNDVIPEMERLGKNVEFETVGTMNNGGTGIAMMKINQGFSITGDKSPHETRLFWFNPNGKESMLLGATNVRLFCQNQLPAAISSARRSAKGDGGFHVSHTTYATARVQAAVATVFDCLYDSDLMRRREERLAQVAASEWQLQQVLDILIPLKDIEPDSRAFMMRTSRREEIVFQYKEGETAESFDRDSGAKLLNAVTYTIYNPSRINADTDLAQVTYSGTVGSRAEKARGVLDVVERVCGIR